MNAKPKIGAGRFGAKVHVHASVTVPTTGFKLAFKPSGTVKKPELDLILTPPKRGTAAGDMISHPEADIDIFIAINQKKLTVNFQGKAIHVTIKNIIT